MKLNTSVSRLPAVKTLSAAIAATLFLPGGAALAQPAPEVEEVVVTG